MPKPIGIGGKANSATKPKSQKYSRIKDYDTFENGKDEEVVSSSIPTNGAQKKAW